MRSCSVAMRMMGLSGETTRSSGTSITPETHSPSSTPRAVSVTTFVPVCSSSPLGSKSYSLLARLKRTLITMAIGYIPPIF